MNTSSLCQFIEDYHDQVLSGDELDSFCIHLDQCAQCQDELAVLRRADAELAAAWNRVVLPEVAVTPDQRKFSGMPTGPAIGMNRVWQTAAAVLLLASAVAATWLIRSGGNEIAENEIAQTPSRDSTHVDAPPKPPAAIELIGDRPMFAAVNFDGETMSMPMGSTPELTVYAVIPKTTYINPKPEF